MALNNAVYLWSAATGETELLMQCSGSDDYVTSVKWASDGNHVAVGTSDADVQLWDANRVKQVQFWFPESALKVIVFLVKRLEKGHCMRDKGPCQLSVYGGKAVGRGVWHDRQEEAHP